MTRALSPKTKDRKRVFFHLAKFDSIGCMGGDTWRLCTMECAIGVAGGAIAPPDFNLVGQPILYAPPDFFKQNCQLIVNMLTITKI